MAQVLIVDDSPLERTIAATILQQNLPEIEVTSLSSSLDAVETLKQQHIDVVVTDLKMPGLNGLELIEEIRKCEINTPVVLMTGYGTEEIAVQALRAGAANYVPKRELEDHLVRTVENILAMSQSKRSEARLLSCMTNSHFDFTLNNDNQLSASLVKHLQNQIRIQGVLDESNVIRVGVALHEALSNAMLHGNLELDSDLRQEDDSIFYRLADQRRREAPYRERKVFVTASVSNTELRISIRDEGPGFDVANVLDPERPIDLERIGGRGLLLIQSFMDVTYHNASGNQLTMIKFATPQTSPEPQNLIERDIANEANENLSASAVSSF